MRAEGRKQTPPPPNTNHAIPQPGSTANPRPAAAVACGGQNPANEWRGSGFALRGRRASQAPITNTNSAAPRICEPPRHSSAFGGFDRSSLPLFSGSLLRQKRTAGCRGASALRSFRGTAVPQKARNARSEENPSRTGIKQQGATPLAPSGPPPLCGGAEKSVERQFRRKRTPPR